MKRQKLSDTHPFLYHYTDTAALSGILKTNELWATHIRFLNDQSEYELAQKFVESQLVPRNKSWLNGIVKTDLNAKKIMDGLGGIDHSATELAKSASEAFYKVTGDDFFVTSFCGTPLGDYEKENGLLSQWRGYGNQQGFMLVFETKVLETMMEQERQHFSYFEMYLADAVYSNNENNIQQELGSDIKTIRDFVNQTNNFFAGTSKQPVGREAMLSFMRLATRYKHHAFDEEKEVRLVGAVAKHETVQNSENLTSTEKPVELRTGRSGLTPFIKLFGKNSAPLPLRKIIVGPSKNKSDVARALQKGLQGQSIEVDVSKIPYV
jgi:Protein of unknown function (DUF2971)